MKKYRTPLLTLDLNATASGGLADVYLASEVDHRIAELSNEVELLNDVCERKQERLDKANTRIEALEKSIRDLHAEDFEWCQECGVGSTDAWARVKTLVGL